MLQADWTVAVGLVRQRLGESGMNCVELQASLVEIEDGRSAEQRDHLKSCTECSALVTELILIASAAVELRADRRTQSSRLEIHRKQHCGKKESFAPSVANRSLLPSLAAAGLGALDGSCRRRFADHSRLICSPAFARAPTCPRHRARRCGFRSGDCRPERRRLVAGSSSAVASHEGGVCRQSSPRQRVHPGCEKCDRRQS